MYQLEEMSEDMDFHAFNHLLWVVIAVTLLAMTVSWVILSGLFYDKSYVGEEQRSEGTVHDIKGLGEKD
jgi:hypothetical protein